MKIIKEILIAIGRPGARLLVRWWKKKKSLIYVGLTVITMIMSGGSVWFYKKFLKDLPNVNEIYYPPRLSTKILDRKGEALYKFYEGENRSWTKLSDIPQSLVWATIAIEDKNFYQHHGLSIKGIMQATWYNLKKSEDEKLRGGSTITQQLVKNVFFSNENKWERKIKEVCLTLILEGKLSKDEILERYFNQVPYGGDVYGAQEASLRYFGKNVWEINMAEAAFLAGLPAAPSSYSPFSQYPYFAYMRQKRVIEEMAKAGFISEIKMMEMLEEEVKVVPEVRSIRAPHFVFFVKNFMEEKYGFKNFDRLGLRVVTSLDSQIQQMAEKVVAGEVEKIRNLRVSNGAALVIDVKTGEILAMVGSKDYNADNIDGKVNVVGCLRQPGSAIKPINYLLALERGKTLMSVVDDSPVTYNVPGQKPYSPQNYNGKYMGKVTLKTALASSLNVPSVKLLGENGVKNMIDLAEKMGIKTWQERNRFGLALALGAGEVRMIELAGAYSVFANLGEKVEINPIMEVENYLGEKVYTRWVEKERVVDAGRAFLINEALSSNEARAPIFGWNSKLNIKDKTVAVKTGTTNSLKDNWCIGWTPRYLSAVWVGNNDSSPMSWVASGITGATPIWHEIMSKLLEEREDEKWEIPKNVIKAKVCGKEEYFIAGSENRVECRAKPTPTETKD